jgi:CheY-like chemotaxis protein
MQKPCGESFVSIVDDDPGICLALKALMRSAGLAAETFFSAEEFLEFGKLAQTACLVLDMRLPRMSGLELQRLLASTGVRVPIIFITAHDQVRRRRRPFSWQGVQFLSGPSLSPGQKAGHAAVSQPLDTPVRHEKVGNRPSAPLTLGFRALAFLDDFLMPSLWLPCDPQSALFPGRRLPRAARWPTSSATEVNPLRPQRILMQHTSGLGSRMTPDWSGCIN